MVEQQTLDCTSLWLNWQFKTPGCYTRAAPFWADTTSSDSLLSVLPDGKPQDNVYVKK